VWANGRVGVSGQSKHSGRGRPDHYDGRDRKDVYYVYSVHEVQLVR